MDDNFVQPYGSQCPVDLENKKKERKRMKKLLQPALQSFLYSATILYNNNVSLIPLFGL